MYVLNAGMLTSMSFDRYPAEKLSRQAKDAIAICGAIGLTIVSEVRVKHGMLSYHTVSLPDGTVILKDAYTGSLMDFVKGIIAANSKQTKSLPNE